MKRVLILVVAYNAERTIDAVLARIPADRLPPGVEVLVIDDSSADATFERARCAAMRLNLTVLRNPFSQGYGGNQKIGYRYAIEKGFDVVALLHGDGQYDPGRLPDLLAPVLAGEADACFGSRFMGGAASGHGMPRYKYLGNRILTALQNRALGLRLTECHCGYRVYAVPALKQVPFEYNTDGWHFDAEVLIQFAMRRLRICEVPVPAYAGGGISLRNGFGYAWNVTAATLASRAHLMGVFYRKRFDVRRHEDVYDLKAGYLSSHTAAIEAVRPGASVLDLACGPGYVAAELRKKGCRVTGIDRVPAAGGAFDEFILHDLDASRLPGGVGRYDFILALDCIEHLDFPERLLAGLRESCYAEDTVLVVTAPNVGFLLTRLSLLLGQFNYGRQGILDLTHRRLYTFASLRQLIEQEGYRIRRMRGIPAPFPKAIGDNAVSRLLLWTNRALIAVTRRLFAYQIYLEAEMLPPLGRLLARTIEATRTRTE